jgi:membrane fusion protein, heavy metal efflux system
VQEFMKAKLVAPHSQFWKARVRLFGKGTPKGTCHELIVGLALLAIGCSRAMAQQQPLETEDIPRIDNGRILFSNGYAKRMGLESTEVTSEVVIPSVAVVGTVTFDPEHVARVGTRLRGLVKDVNRFEGASVRKGETLATVDSPELGEAQASVASLRAEFEAAQRNSDREHGLAESKLTTLKESETAAVLARKYQAVLAAAEQRVISLSGELAPADGRGLGLHSIKAPIDGTIVERQIAKGQLAESNQLAFVIANLDRVWVELAVFERSLKEIHTGDEVELRPLGMRNLTISGRVARVGQVLEHSTRASPIRVEVDNRERRLRPGQVVDAAIKTVGAATVRGPVVPLASVILVDGSPTVFVLDTPNSVRVSPVELGASDGTRVAVRGVEVGHRVIVTGAFELKSELFR